MGVVSDSHVHGMTDVMTEMTNTEEMTGTVMTAKEGTMAIGTETATGISGDTMIVIEVMIEIEVEKGDTSIATGTVIGDSIQNVQILLEIYPRYFRSNHLYAKH